MKENPVLNKMLVCLYVIIGLLALNSILILVTNTNSSSNNKKDDSSQKETNSDYDVSMMKTIDINEMLSYFKDGSTQIVYMGRSNCSACISFLPTLQKAQSEYGYKTLYIDINNVSQSTSEFKEFIKKLDKKYTMQTNEGEKTEEFGYFYGYTPAVFIIKDGKMIDGVIGALDYDTFAKFLETNGYKK